MRADEIQESHLDLPEYLEDLELLTHGGMGAVFRARHKVTQAKLAVKVLLPSLSADAQCQKRFIKEAKATGMLSNPHIVRIFDCGVSDSRAYMVMEFIEGPTLQERLKTAGPLSAEEFYTIFLQAVDGLEHAHDQGIIHRDIKPSNIMLSAHTDGKPFVKLVDFGIAKVLTAAEQGDPLTATGDVLGTPTYMSPEQCLGRTLDARSDVYSLGCVMYHSLCGSAPIVGDTSIEIMTKQATMLVDFSSLPGPFQALVARCMEKEPAHRYQSMAELKADLLHLKLKGKSRFHVTGKQRRRIRSWVTWVVSLIIGFGLGFAVIQLFQSLRFPG